MTSSRRSGSRPGTGRSHYQFKNWTWGRCGQRLAPVPARAVPGRYPDLINTCYKNPAKGTLTLYTLALDLDAHRAWDQWKTKAGVLCWPRIKKFLRDRHPELFAYLFAAVRSTGGKGLALYIAISPLELISQNTRARRSADTLCELLIAFFNQHGLGADPSAKGLNRDFCNWQNPEQRLYERIVRQKVVQSARIPVVRILLGYLKSLGISSYIRKSDRPELLYPDKRVEAKLSLLYIELLEHWLIQETTVYRKVSELTKTLKVSRPFLEKFLKHPPPWLRTNYCGYKEGWALSITPEIVLTRRSQILRIKNNRPPHTNPGKPLTHPETVQDGGRNMWITQACLILKHSGLSEVRSLAIMRQQVTKIPGFQESKNCQSVTSIVKSVFRSRPELQGICPGIAPDWLLTFVQMQGTDRSDQLNETKSEQKQIRKKCSYRELQTNLEKGGYTPEEFLRKVSGDQCFIFRKNFYSLPSSWIGKTVLVSHWQSRLRIYNPDTKKFICAHPELTRTKGQYSVSPGHMNEHIYHQKPGLKYHVRRIQATSPEKGELAQALVDCYGIFSLRKLWKLQFFK